MTDHHLPASVETCHWGYFDATTQPALTIASGDRVVIDTVSGGPDVLPPDGFHVPSELYDIHARSERQVPGHILTGPVAVEGAEPGDVLEVRIEDVSLRQDWGYNFHRPLSGTLPDEFPQRFDTNIPLDADRGVATMPWGLELPLAPFMGVMGTAPPVEWGRLTSLVPRAFGGNLDCKELVAGTTLYLPVFVPGANFSCGDGHGCQGDGEVNVTAIETALQGTFTLTVLKDAGFDTLRARTPTHLITLAVDPDLDRSAERALSDMIDWLSAEAGLTRDQAYMLCSLSADLSITQTVNGSKGVHCKILSEYAHAA